MNKILVAKDLREINFSYRISDSEIESFSGVLPDYQHKYLKEIGTVGEAIVRAVASVEGVTQFWIQPYHITVDVAKAFDRETIIKEVVRAIASIDGVPLTVEWENRPENNYSLPKPSLTDLWAHAIQPLYSFVDWADSGTVSYSAVTVYKQRSTKPPKMGIDWLKKD